jgi:UvrD-like helicase C-terminal domain
VAIDDDQKQILIGAAEHILDALGEVASAAQGSLAGGGIGSRTGLAKPSNMMVGDVKPERFLHNLNVDLGDHLRRLLLEPFVARVDVDWEDGRPVQTLYFARRSAAGLTGAIKGAQFISSGAALGHLAEYEAGEIASIELNGRERTAHILTRVVLQPKQRGGEWDALIQNFQRVPWGETLEILRHESLRKALEALQGAGLVAAEDIVGQLLQEAAEAVQENQRIRRKVVNRIALRDRPVLNKFQGEIFRLPLDRQVLLFGPPGSGKTTTLIKRLAQKRTSDALPEEEQRLLTAGLAQDLLRPQSWAMFSPAELLRQYLGDAFNREGVPDAGNVRTWEKERHDLARNFLNILRSNGSGRFQLDPQATIIADCTSPGIAHFHDVFAPELEANLLKRCEDAIANLLKGGDEGSRRQAARIQGSLMRDKIIELADALRVFGQSEILQTEIKRLSDQISAELTKAANSLLNRHRGLLDEIVAALAAIRTSEDEEDDEDEDTSDTAPVANTRVEALNALMAALRNWARAVAEGRKNVGGRTRRLLDLIGERMLPDDQFTGIGANIATRSWLRTLVQAPRTFVLGVPRFYARFRRQQVRDGGLFISDETTNTFVARNFISRDEVDVLLLVMLRNARLVLHASGGPRLESAAAYDWLETIRGRYLTQVFVDEATDLSAVQLACTIELTDPRLRSWFACGDLRQRITVNGLQSEAEIQWLNSTTGARIDLRMVDIGYRQSRRLRDLSDAMANLLDVASHAQTTAPPGAEEADVWPLLAENQSGDTLGAWLAGRIHEVERGVGWLPSIAIFVDGDELIDPLVRRTERILAERNIPIVGCKEGRIVGDAREVRVFDIQHIKGLEFEAVFFIGIDRMAERMPNLFQRYLYVGLTRAATYLGLTCEAKMPHKIEVLRPYFGPVRDWAGP